MSTPEERKIAVLRRMAGLGRLDATPPEAFAEWMAASPGGGGVGSVGLASASDAPNGGPLLQSSARPSTQAAAKRAAGHDDEYPFT